MQNSGTAQTVGADACAVQRHPHTADAACGVDLADLAVAGVFHRVGLVPAEELDQQIRANAYKLMSRQSLAAAQAAGRAPAPESAPPAPPAEEAPKKGKAKENPVAAPAPRDMDELDALLNLDISAEDFEG